jgi:hypothetical protein
MLHLSPNRKDYESQKKTQDIYMYLRQPARDASNQRHLHTLVGVNIIGMARDNSCGAAVSTKRSLEDHCKFTLEVRNVVLPFNKGRNTLS